MQDFQTICRRADERRKYNPTRQLLAKQRRLGVIKLMKCGLPNTCQTGVWAKIARYLKVTENIISRDIWKILSDVNIKSD